MCAQQPVHVCHECQLGLPNTVQNNIFREVSVVSLFSVKNGQFYGPKNFFLHLKAQKGVAAKAAAYSSKRVSREARRYTSQLVDCIVGL
jgi:hypothetical protein